MLVGAAYLPVTHGIAIGAMILLDHGRLPDLVDPVRRGPAVEELLRHQAGLGGEPFPRWAQADTTLAGVPIARGEQVLVHLEAAHRDPDPHTFDPDRTTPHMAFGRGPHHCLGAALARLSVGAALGTLAERIPTLRMAVPVEDVEWQRYHLDTFPTAVPVTWWAAADLPLGLGDRPREITVIRTSSRSTPPPRAADCDLRRPAGP